MTDSEQNKIGAGEPKGCPAAPKKEKPPKQKMTPKRLFKEWILPFGLEILALWLLVHFVCYLPIIPTGSMEPTIAEHSMLFAWRVHDPSKLERGDIVVFDSEELGGKNLIKRLIGLPGDSVTIGEDGSLTINGMPYPEEYVVYQMGMPMEFSVPEDHYLFMGDNRANSYDARYWSDPYIPADAIGGRAVFTLFPFKNFGVLK